MTREVQPQGLAIHARNRPGFEGPSSIFRSLPVRSFRYVFEASPEKPEPTAAWFSGPFLVFAARIGMVETPSRYPSVTSAASSNGGLLRLTSRCAEVGARVSALHHPRPTGA